MIGAHASCVIFRAIGVCLNFTKYKFTKELFVQAASFIYMMAIMYVQNKIDTKTECDDPCPNYCKYLKQMRYLEVAIFISQMYALSGYLIISKLFKTVKLRSQVAYDDDQFMNLLVNKNKDFIEHDNFFMSCIMTYLMNLDASILVFSQKEIRNEKEFNIMNILSTFMTLFMLMSWLLIFWNGTSKK
jgi:hypothetical protein